MRFPLKSQMARTRRRSPVFPIMSAWQENCPGACSPPERGRVTPLRLGLERGGRRRDQGADNLRELPPAGASSTSIRSLTMSRPTRSPLCTAAVARSAAACAARSAFERKGLPALWHSGNVRPGNVDGSSAAPSASQDGETMGLSCRIASSSLETADSSRRNDRSLRARMASRSTNLVRASWSRVGL